MTSSIFKTFTVIPTVAVIFFAVGCGGESAPAPTPAAAPAPTPDEKTKPKAPTGKTKGGVKIESEENTPARFKNRDN